MCKYRSLDVESLIIVVLLEYFRILKHDIDAEDIIISVDV